MGEIKLPERSEIDDKYKWRLEDIYSNDELWERDFSKAEKMYPEMEGFHGTLMESGKNLLKCFRKDEELFKIVEKLFVYARMRRDEDNAESKYQAMADRAESLYINAASAVSFIEPELTVADVDVLYKYLEETDGLGLYKFKIDELIRQKAHILSEKEEKILTMSSEATQGGDDIFTMFDNADIKFPLIADESGKETELTKGRYTMFLENRDRRVRQDAFKALYSSYGAFANTLAACLSNNVKSNKFYSKVRNYGSCLEASLSLDDVNVSVYNNLIDTINRNLPKLGRYLEIRQKILNLETLHMYDLYVPIVKTDDKKYSYEEAKEIVYKALAPMGDEYCSLIRKAYEEGWIDVYESRGKTGGGYSWGCYGIHPYVLLNWTGTINDVFTLAHELGHSMHSYYSNREQPYVYATYKIFVAEVASTVNENLLIDYMLKNSTDETERAYLLNHYLEEFRGTMFRQVMFAEFEKIIHEAAEAGESLTREFFCQRYYELNQKYFSGYVEVDKEIEMEWGRIPHFYTSFYVYKYATGFSAAVALSSAILKNGETAVEKYKKFLMSGGSDYPIELLKKAGVDLSDSKPIQSAMDEFERVLDEFERYYS